MSQRFDSGKIGAEDGQHGQVLLPAAGCLPCPRQDHRLMLSGDLDVLADLAVAGDKLLVHRSSRNHRHG